MYSSIAAGLALAISQSSTSTPLLIPTKITCPPSTSLIRTASAAGAAPTAQTLSPGEAAYVAARAESVLPGAWGAYLANVNASAGSAGTALPGYVASILSPSTASNATQVPRVGIAVSGGSYRAALFGAGVLSALDGRNGSGVKAGTGGLLQAATYLAGLSGGSWLVTALTQAEFPTIPELVFPTAASSNGTNGENGGYGGFLAQAGLLAPGANPRENSDYLDLLVADAAAKKAASGLPVTVTDVWSGALARHFVNGTTAQNIADAGTHGKGVLLSGLANLATFQAHGQPFPIVVVDTIPPTVNRSEIVPGNSVPLTSEIWEFNVFESGSWDPTLAAFVPTSLLGSTNASNCMAGLDQAAFIIGMSSNLFNAFNVSESSLSTSFIGPAVSAVSSAFPSEGVRLDAGAVPNPFKGVNPTTYTSSNEEFLAFVDGGSDGEVLPLQPLLVRARGVDTIVAIDATADTAENYVNGTNLINTARRVALFGAQYAFPAVPVTAESFVQLGLTRRPTFFGCNESAAPLVIYVANGGAPADGAAPATNTSTIQLSYTPQEVQTVLDQAFAVATRGVNGSDAQWGACLACAVVDRARARGGVPRAGLCDACFARYCWDGLNGNITVSSGASTGGGSRAGPGWAAGILWLLLAGLGFAVVGV